MAKNDSKYITILYLTTGEIFQHALTKYEETVIEDHAEDWLRANGLNIDELSYMVSNSKPKIVTI